MAWGPIVVGVDASSEAAGAATMGYRIARAAAENCDLVHATPDVWAPFAAVGDPTQVQEMQRLQLAVARHQVTEALRGVAPELLEELDVRLGRAAVVLQEAVRERGAGLLVLGGKHHTALERWLGGSTSLNVVRTTEVPVLVTTGSPATAIRRVLVAADLSGAARPTIALAERFARLVGAQLRVLSVFEPLPILPDVPAVDPASYYALSQDLLQREIWPLVATPGTEKIVRHGMVVETLLREATDWSADVLVVGSHGKGWTQRILLGSVTERLLNDLPTSLLVAPVGARVPIERAAQVEAVVA
jgi:nucleotide-binding universal stress UspA family protein